MSKLKLKRGCPKEEFPRLDGNYTCMARVLDLHMYTRQFNRATESGVIFDDIIRPGLEDIGETVVESDLSEWVFSIPAVTRIVPLVLHIKALILMLFL